MLNTPLVRKWLICSITFLVSFLHWSNSFIYHEVLSIIMGKFKLPDSAKLVLTVLADRGNMNLNDISSAVNLPVKTTRYALKRLYELQMVFKQANLDDMRSIYYSINPDYYYSIINYNFEELIKVDRIKAKK